MQALLEASHPWHAAAAEPEFRPAFARL